MTRFFSTLTAILSVFLACAQSSPDLRLHTSIYDSFGPTNSFTLTLGAAPGHTGYADVVCSGGNQSEAQLISAYYDDSSYALLATNVACQVDSLGVVEVFCDPGVIIDYICVTGAEITSIEVKNPEAIEILSLEHNMLSTLDLTDFTNLQALYLADNPFDTAPLVVGRDKPYLTILDISQAGDLDPDFDIATYPALQSFDAMSTHSLTRLTPAGCPRLQKLSIDNTSVASIDISHNPELLILNISESAIDSIDLRGNPKLQQLFATHASAMNSDAKLSSIDVSNCPDLIYLFLTDNNLASLDVSRNTRLQDLYVAGNRLTSLNLDNNTALLNVFLQRNNMDFNTLPLPSPTWLDYEMKQRPLAVPQANLVGTPINLASRIIRPDSETMATVFSLSQLTPGIETVVDPSSYTFADGVITFNTVIPDSVYVSFYNSAFPDITLETNNFLIKDESTFGQPDKLVSISTNLTAGAPVVMYVGVEGASPLSPKTFYVDAGDGVRREFIATSSDIPVVANVDTAKPSFGQIVVYMAEGDKLTAFRMDDTKINSINLSACHHLQYLTLINTGLRDIDLKWCRRLSHLTLSGNDFADRLTLAGANGGYSKNFLSHIVLPSNNMTSVKLNEPGAWRYIDLSDNQLENIDLTDADYLQYLDVSHNRMTLLKANYCGMLDTLRCNDNMLDSIRMPESFNIRHLDFANNRFTLKNMPARHNLAEENFIYAPQATIMIPTKGPGYNLSDEYVVIDNQATVYTWLDSHDQPLTEGTDYSIDRGVTRFADSTIGRTLHCSITHPAYPAFSGRDALQTSPMLSAGMPTHLLGRFTTPVGGDTLRLSVASAVPDNALYIDWSGTNTLEQYPMSTVYTLYSPVTTANAQVKVWSYDDNDNLTVFSLGGTPLADVDLSPMTHLTSLSLSGTKISELKLPASPEISELMLDGNSFSDFDLSVYPRLSFVSFADNNFRDINLAVAPNVGSANFSGNNIATVNIDNPRLWSLGLSNNLIETIDLSGAPNLYQLFLNYNRLSEINLDNLNDLHVVYLDHNCFDFSNLPVPRDSWTLYTYGEQPEIKIEGGSTVDLSRLARRDGVETTFTWFYGYPDIDTLTGEISGEELFIDEEYTIADGVTTFLTTLDRVCCVLTNPLFPKTYLITNAINTIAASTQDIGCDNIRYRIDGHDIHISGLAGGTRVSVFNTAGVSVSSGKTDSLGACRLSVPARGIYILAASGIGNIRLAIY